MNELDIQKFGKGMLHKEDVRDYAFGATTPFDWTQPIKFDTALLPFLNQNGSQSCVAQSTVTMARIFYLQHSGKLEDFSARFIYSQIFLPVSGGAYLRDGIATLLKRGVELESLFPSEPETEAHMRDRTGLDYNEATKFDIYPDDYAYASVPCQIDAIASAIRDNTCVMLGIRGNNAGWAHTIITPPTSVDWAHAVVGVGTEIINGKKYIRFINSWGETWGDRSMGLLSEDYFNSGNVVAAYVITTNFQVPSTMLKTIILNNEQYILGVDGRAYHIYNVDTLKTLQNAGIISQDAPQSVDSIDDSGKDFISLLRE